MTKPDTYECHRCSQTKPFSPPHFYADKNSKWGILKICAECHTKYAWEKNVRKQYNLTVEEYDALKEGGCGICGERTHNRMALDHCHTTGKVRGPLCPRCNTGIGQFRDSPELLRAAAEYIEKHREDTETP